MSHENKARRLSVDSSSSGGNQLVFCWKYEDATPWGHFPTLFEKGGYWLAKKSLAPWEVGITRRAHGS